MKEIFANFTFFGVVISLAGYELGILLKKKFKFPLLNPLLVSIVFVIGFLVLFRIDYDTYNNGAKYLSYLLTPATVCLAIPLYQQMELLKKNMLAVILGILSGVLASLCSTLIFAFLFGMTHKEYVTMLPKSITTAIGMAVSEELGGIVTITIATIILTGIIGNIIAETVCRIFKIEEPIAKGVAIGSASHAIERKGNEWENRRCHEQSCHRSCRTDYGCRSILFRTVFVNWYKNTF